jgi:hypothetical protein
MASGSFNYDWDTWDLSPNESQQAAGYQYGIEDTLFPLAKQINSTPISHIEKSSHIGEKTIRSDDGILNISCFQLLSKSFLCFDDFKMAQSV